MCSSFTIMGQKYEPLWYKLFKTPRLPSVLIYSTFCEHHNAGGVFGSVSFSSPKLIYILGCDRSLREVYKNRDHRDVRDDRSTHTLSPLPPLADSVPQSMRAVRKIFSSEHSRCFQVF